MNFIWSGTTGIDKKYICTVFLEHSKKKHPDKTITIVDLEDLLKEELGAEDITQILNSYNRDAQKVAWRKAFNIAQDIFHSEDSEYSILCAHLIYFRCSQFFSPMNIKLIQEFSLDGIISFIDDIYLIKQRIDQRNLESPTSTDVCLRDLIAWRSVEYHQAEFLASVFEEKKPLSTQILSIKQPVTTLDYLMFESNVLKMYIGHPITVAKQNPEIVREIECFKSKIHREFTVFDPTTIDERLLTYSLKSQCPDWERKSNGKLAEFDITLNYKDRWPINHEPILCENVQSLFPIKIKASEIISVMQAIDDQIRSRDYRLISQSDIMVAYRPNLGRRLSIGVFSEMQYTRDVLFKHCQMYFPEEDGEIDESPFQGGSEAHGTIEELLENLRRYEPET